MWIPSYIGYFFFAYTFSEVGGLDVVIFNAFVNLLNSFGLLSLCH